MKVELHADGTLVIEAQTSLEAFALTQWDNKRRQGKAKLVIDTEGEWLAWDGLKTFNSVFKSLGPVSEEFKAWLEEKRSKGEPIAQGAENLSKLAGQPIMDRILEEIPPKTR